MGFMNTQDFRIRLAEVMASKKLTQKDVETQYGVKQESISCFLRGVRGLSGASVLALLPLLSEGGLNADKELEDAHKD
jgi:predicted XRE-type DNA-binding protein